MGAMGCMPPFYGMPLKLHVICDGLSTSLGTAAQPWHCILIMMLLRLLTGWGELQSLCGQFCLIWVQLDTCQTLLQGHLCCKCVLPFCLLYSPEQAQGLGMRGATVLCGPHSFATSCQAISCFPVHWLLPHLSSSLNDFPSMGWLIAVSLADAVLRAAISAICCL